MNRNDVIDVLTAVAAATRRTIGEADVDVWQAIIGDLPRYNAKGTDMALAAVRSHLRESPGVWLEPGHVHQGIRAAIREELEHEPDEVREARQELLSRKVAADVDELAARKALPGPVKYQRPTRSSAITIRCPWCKANSGQRCVIPNTNLLAGTFHPSRVEAAEGIAS